MRAEPPSDEFLDLEELGFVAGFDALMDAAHYTRLSKQEWEVAEKEEFTVQPRGTKPLILTLNQTI